MGSAPQDAWYYREPATQHGKARVLRVDGKSVILDRTLLFPGGGGQAPDAGTIGGQRVTGLAWAGDEVVHSVDDSGFRPGDEVEVIVDWKRRHDLMRAHTGEHLLTGCLSRATNGGIEVVKVQLEPELKRVYYRGELTPQAVRAAVGEANTLIGAGAPVRAVWVTEGEARALKARARWERLPEGDVRVVSIGEFDRSACAGIHVPDIADLRLLIVTRVARSQSVWEIDFLTGSPAAKFAAGRSLEFLDAAQQLASPPELLVATAGNMKREVERLRRELAEAARLLLDSSPAVPIGPAGSPADLFIGVFPAFAPRSLQEGAGRKVTAPRSVVLWGSRGESAFLVLACSADLNLDCPALLRPGLVHIEGKGGGEARFAQGGGKRPDRLEEGLALVRAAVEQALR